MTDYSVLCLGRIVYVHSLIQFCCVSIWGLQPLGGPGLDSLQRRVLHRSRQPEQSAIKWDGLAYGRCPAAALDVPAFSSDLKSLGFWDMLGHLDFKFKKWRLHLKFSLWLGTTNKCSLRRMQPVNWDATMHWVGLQATSAQDEETRCTTWLQFRVSLHQWRTHAYTEESSILLCVLFLN